MDTLCTSLFCRKEARKLQSNHRQRLHPGAQTTHLQPRTRRCTKTSQLTQVPTSWLTWWGWQDGNWFGSLVRFKHFLFSASCWRKLFGGPYATPSVLAEQQNPPLEQGETEEHGNGSLPSKARGQTQSILRFGLGKWEAKAEWVFLPQRVIGTIWKNKLPFFFKQPVLGLFLKYFSIPARLCQIQLAFRNQRLTDWCYAGFSGAEAGQQILMKFIISRKHGWQFQFLVPSLDLQIIFQLPDKLSRLSSCWLLNM